MDDRPSATGPRRGFASTSTALAGVLPDPTLPLEVPSKPLPIVAISALNTALTPSVLYSTADACNSGPRRGARPSRLDNARDPLISFTTVLAHQCDDALQPSCSLHGSHRTFVLATARALYSPISISSFAVLDLAQHAARPRGRERRYTSPVWRPGSGVDLAFESIFNEAAAVSQKLGRLFMLQGEGISIAQCKDALDKAAAAPGNGLLETGIFEPHAAAAGALAFTSQPTRFVIVLDIGAGTNSSLRSISTKASNRRRSPSHEARQCSALRA